MKQETQVYYKNLIIINNLQLISNKERWQNYQSFIR